MPARPPANVAQELAGEAGFVWLDSELGSGKRARWSFMSVHPEETVSDIHGADAMFAQLRKRIRPTAEGSTTSPAPFQGGWIGYLNYGFASTLMAWQSRHAGRGPDAVFGYYPVCLVWDHLTGTCGLLATDAHAARSPAARVLTAALENAPAAVVRSAPPPLDWRAKVDETTYVERVSIVQDYIRAGDIYQANLSQRFSARLPDGLPPLDHYLAARLANRAPFSAYLALSDLTIGSTSPERFISVTGDIAEARPIKGTIAASADPEEDTRRRTTLSSSVKDRAENIMIVDLLRNDFSRVCRPHSVKTPEVCAIESYEGLHHLVSSVTGVLDAGYDALDLLAAAFPGGSITGAPKRRAMDIIDELEDTARGPYCGAIGYLSVTGTLDLSISIRTLVYEGDEVHLNVGGGITNRSVPKAEYDETLVKAARLIGGSAP